MSDINTNPPVSPKPTPKAKGPIRHGAVVPTTIFFVICFLLFRFLLDHGIKKAIEWGGTQAVGAEVNVGSVHTSFLGASFHLNGLQITNKEDPSNNSLQIGQIRFAFSWDALLRLKFVVVDAGVDGIALYAPRKSPGWVKPPEPPKPAGAPASAEGPGALDQIQNSVSQQLQGSGPKDPLGGISKLLAGTSQANLVDSAKSGLKSAAKIKELQAEITERQKVWKEKLAKLPQKKDFDDIVAEAKTLKFDLNKPQELAENAKKAKDLKERADVKLKEIKSTTDGIKADTDHISAEYKDIDNLVKEDINNVQANLNISDLNAKDLSRAMFANLVAQKLGSYAKYLALAEKYMANSKSKSKEDKEELIPPKRGAGKNYRFPITTGYPLFWVKKATISSKASDEGFSGNINGTLTNLTTDPAVVGKPTILDVAGDFPKAKVMDTHLNLTLNHIAEPVDSLEMRIGSFPVQEISLTKSSDLTLGIKEASGDSNVSAVYKNSAIDFKMNNDFQNVKYDLAASGAIKDALDGVLAGIPKVTVSASATGSLSSLSFNVDSNLGSELSKGLQKYVQGKLDAVKKQIQDQIQSQISGPKKDLAAQMGQATGQANSDINKEKQEADQAQKQVTGSTSSSSGGANGLKDQLLKGLHF